MDSKPASPYVVGIVNLVLNSSILMPATMVVDM